MNFIVGLGNPGLEYQNSRHNVGWMLVDFLRSAWDMPEFIYQKKQHSDISKDTHNTLIKPQTFMNKSGEAVVQVFNWRDREALHSREFDDLFVVHDDLDLEFGTYKIKFGSGPKIHNGVNSIRQELNTDQFWYVRIGVDSRSGDRRMPGQKYVLSRFGHEESQRLKEVFHQIEERLLQLIKQ